jgi:hypothetical protein
VNGAPVHAPPTGGTVALAGHRREVISGGCIPIPATEDGPSPAVHYTLVAVEKLTGWAAMTIYPTRYRDPKRQRWVNAWSETRVTAEFRRAEIEQRFAPKELEVAIERFELNSGKADIVRFLNEHADAIKSQKAIVGSVPSPWPARS